MNDNTDPFSRPEHSNANTARQFPGKICANIFLPAMIYEALPVAYVSAGMLLVLGSVYIGIGYGPMVGYLAVGLSCILAGVAVNAIRRRQRSS